MKCNIRIITQYRENYGSELQPHWKMKGSVEFLIKGVDDNDVIYLDSASVDEAIASMLAERSGTMCSYELLEWELLFAEPMELSPDVFNGKITEIYDRDYGK